MPEIKVYSRNGKLVIDMDGYVGEACLKDLETIVRVLIENGVNIKLEKEIPKDERAVPAEYVDI